MERACGLRESEQHRGPKILEEAGLEWSGGGGGGGYLSHSRRRCGIVTNRVLKTSSPGVLYPC